MDGSSSLEQQQLLQQLISSLGGQNNPNKGQTPLGAQQQMNVPSDTPSGGGSSGLPASPMGAAGQAMQPVNSALQKMALNRIGASLSGGGSGANWQQQAADPSNQWQSMTDVSNYDPLPGGAVDMSALSDADLAALG